MRPWPRPWATSPPRRVLDVGCGTGYYLDGVLDALGADPTGAPAALGMDLSAPAVARTVRTVGQHHPEASVDGLVADVWSPLPIRDASADVILNVFAPRNAAEFHRVLRPDGLLAIVVPQDTHLQELRAEGLMLDVQPDKAALLIDGMGAYFAPEARRSVSSTMALAPADVLAAVGMGPSAHHTTAGGPAANAPEARQVTAAFDLLLFRRRPSSPSR